MVEDSQVQCPAGINCVRTGWMYSRSEFMPNQTAIMAIMAIKQNAAAITHRSSRPRRRRMGNEAIMVKILTNTAGSGGVSG